MDLTKEAHDPKFLAAKATLMAIRASTGNPHVVQSYTITPAGKQGTIEEAAAMLAALTKPVRCQGLMAEGTLRVDCVVLNSAEASAHSMAAERNVRSFGMAVHRHNHAGISDPLIRLSGIEGSLLIPLSVLETWFRDYSFPHGMRFDAPDRIARSQGICGVIVLGGPGELSIVRVTR